MTQDANPPPKLEDILASIRRVIANEDSAPDPSEEVLELTPAMAASEPPPASSQPLSDMQVRGYEGSQTTLEALVREMLQPMLKEWLDANLPELVETIVTREVARITRRGG